MPFTTLTTKVGEVMDFIDSNDFSHFIVFDNNKQWIANIPTTCFYDHDENDCIEDLLYASQTFYLQTDDDLSVMIDICSRYQANVLPIISDKQEVVDIISTQTITKSISESLFLTDNGCTLIIEHNIEEISFTKIAQVVESNDAKLLGIITLAVVENKMQILLRTNHRNTIAIMNDFRRFGFSILSRNTDDSYQNKLIEHSNYLNKFLNL